MNCMIIIRQKFSWRNIIARSIITVTLLDYDCNYLPQFLIFYSLSYVILCFLNCPPFLTLNYDYHESNLKILKLLTWFNCLFKFQNEFNSYLGRNIFLFLYGFIIVCH